MDMIEAMEKDDTVKVLIIISKPPAKAVRDRISDRLSNFKKPVVTLFLGEKPEYHEENFYHAYTLDEAARLAVGLVRGQDIAEGSVGGGFLQLLRGRGKEDNQGILLREAPWQGSCHVNQGCPEP